MTDRKYKFNWDLLGDIELRRPNLGNTTRVEVYRLMQFTIRDTLEVKYGVEAADEIFYAAGKLAGESFYKNYLSEVGDVSDFVKQLQSKLKDMGIGVLRVESMSDGAEKLVLTVDEDLDCSGLPETDFEVCVYDEGFIAGILENYTGSPYIVKEVDCWCTGDRTCRFTANKSE